MKYYTLLTALVLFVSCKNAGEQPSTKEKKWTYERTIELDSIRPIGIASSGKEYYLSDGDHNRIVKLDGDFQVLKSFENLDRPMHIDLKKTDGVEELLIPEYGSDGILHLTTEGRKYLNIPDSLDAPAGISSFKDELAIADFYNNRILYYNGENWSSFGKPGKDHGQFNYPTDVQITENYIFVADAYNNRVQVFTRDGVFVNAIGEDQDMNAATGIFVNADDLFITDFENNRVFNYSIEGNLKSILTDQIHKPIDLLTQDGKLLIANYQQAELVIYSNL
ncbi:MAG: NHL repeat-containing protein [Nonlabens sp.]